MAEILGLASSIITIVGVAGKLGTSTVQLKRLWDEVQDVPESIRSCIDHLELLAPVIEEMGNEFQQTRHMVQNDSAAKRSLEYSRKAVETLETLVRDMESQITATRKRKRFVAQLKVMMKKEVIEEHQRQLNSALQLVSLSQQTYLIALSRSQSAIMVSELKSWHESEKQKIVEQKPDALITAENKDIKQDSISDTSQTSSISVKRPGNKSIPWHRPGFLGSFFYHSHEVTEHLYAPDELDKTQVYQLRVQLPRWLMQRAWDFHAFRAHHGWTIQLRAWTTRPREAEIFRLICEGRTDLVVKAIRNKEASIYDRNPFGDSLIEVATQARQLEVLKALMSMGLSLADTNQVMMAFMISDWALLKTDALLIEFGRTLVTEELEEFGFAVQTSDFVWNLPGFWELLRGHVSIRELAAEIIWPVLNPVVPLEMLSRGAVVPKDFRQGHGLFKYRLQGFVRAYLHVFFNCRASMEGWRLLARKIFVGATPSEASFMNTVEILTSLWRRQFALQPFQIWVRRALGMLLEDLAIAGIDLEEYMRWEAIRSYESSYDESSYDSSDDSSDNDSDDCSYPHSHIGRWMVDHLRLRSGMRIPASGPALVIHATGRMPSDWALSWDPCVEELCGEFFQSLRATSHIEQQIPGAWVDFDPYIEQLPNPYRCCMGQLRCRSRRQCGDKNILKENKSLWVRGMRSCEELNP
ncbi:hypothetical protein DER45DRAFT_575732 [Fusarium avenaceum]|nr:hypothetical protein DER45DRAFT_575732 [Fusarium avenaceum]